MPRVVTENSTKLEFCKLPLLIGIAALIIGLITVFLGRILPQNFLLQFSGDSGRVIYYIRRLGTCLIYQGTIVLAVSLVCKYFPPQDKLPGRPDLTASPFLRLLIHPAGFFFIALGICFILYQPGIKEFFLKDDFWHIESSRAKSWRDVLNFFNPARVGHNYRPIGIHFYFFTLHTFFGLNPQGYHLSKILIHAVNTGLLFVLADRLTKNKLLATTSAFLFLTRICHFDSVFWTSTEDPLASIFMLLSVIAYLKPIRKPRSAGVYPRQFGGGQAPALREGKFSDRLLKLKPADSAVSFTSIICFILALMSKEVAVVLPMLLLAYESLIQGDVRSRLGTISLRVLPYFAILCMYLVMQWSYNIISGGPHKPHLGLHVLNNILVYLRLVFNGPFDPLPAFILVFGAFMLVFRESLPKPVPAGNLGVVSGRIPEIQIQESLNWIKWGLSWYIISLLPVIFIDRVTLQYMYIPSMGICFGFGAMIDYIYRQIEISNKLAGIALVAFIMIASFSNTISQLRHQFSTYFKIDYAKASKNYLDDIQRLHPTFPEGATLYFIPRPPATLDYYCKITADGSLFEVFYSQTSPKLTRKFCIRQGDTPRPIKLEDVPRPLVPNVYVFEYDMHHIREISDTI